MGFFSNIGKGFKNLFSGIGRFFKSAFSGKNILKSVAVIAGVYFGGAALGYWDSGMMGRYNGAWKNSALGSEGTLGKWLGRDAKSLAEKKLLETGEGTPDALSSDSIKKSSQMADALKTSFEKQGVKVASKIGEPSSKGILEGAIPSAVDKVASVFGSGATVDDAGKAVAGSGILGWAGKNPVPAMMLAQGAASVFQEDPAVAKAEAEALNRRDIRNNFSVGSVESAANQPYNSNYRNSGNTRSALMTANAPLSEEEYNQRVLDKNTWSGRSGLMNYQRPRKV